MENLWFIIKAIIIGIVEGITEFLPVSSTGHMIIVEDLINFKEGVMPASLYTKQYIDAFTMIIQLGAILAIVVLYWDKIKRSFENFAPSKPKSGFKFWLNIAVSAVPAGVLGLKFHSKINEKLFNPGSVTAALIVGAIWMIFAEKRYRGKFTTKDIDNVTIKQAFIIGCFQCLALWPGMSRSASTIIGAWIVGLSTVAAAEFSFFLALPVMAGVTYKSLKDINVFALGSMHIVGLTVGFIVSFIVALIVVDKFITFLKKKPMRVFAMYRILLGIVLIILSLFNVISM
ncbi:MULTISPECIES: undecaprenyl-diphosphate phosphatase [Clostridium]|uniref:Undecaprenyl-diphosphatase n=1 Tax=Clostridium novyi (strain NT) TaxID=386415 RepID=UPPP_CLONN|nr:MULTISPECIES: undecaprenyl-diphosphate phosphatase [Clostridium]A0Q210.1 RecName: Full=Undecaprenyl-diphosphatase; AltName: Full=Bacitracin resistance protein; AltName: Full=Undecaprenyl pyrophosphate phosphatase [Clostridium novyi NT]ABK61243.1 Putative undecaprenol kinase 2 (Bacitracin resistanceprotein 2) [Clostridium novyi NT]KEH84952.1 UDP-diphosphatase [Clostridium novyi A str. NCTC 538]KEH88467.1 UDP-diphosphatase [Clostridium novyi A str. 4540]KEH90805.1 UDP-diphosphatase [Clostridi